MEKAIFLDRDGTINVDYGYVSKVENFFLLPNTIEGLKKFSEMGYMLIVISNQSGIGRDYYTLEDYHNVTNKMLSTLKQSGIKITDCFYCPHSPESNCDCRKPKPKMIQNAIEKWNVDPNLSWFIGDKKSDIDAGKALSIKTILISKSPKEYNQDCIVPDLLAAANYISNQF